MKIFRPTRSNRMTQGFGENIVCTRLGNNNTPVFPYDTINKPKNGKCPSGYTDFYKALGVDGHAGMDFAGYSGEPIHFDILDAVDIHGNEVEWEALPTSSTTAGFGVLIRSKQPVALTKPPTMPGASFKMVEKQYRQLGGGNHLMRYYGHFKKPTHLKPNQSVKPGDLVGYMGATGAVTGVHTHRHLTVCGTNEQNPWFYIDGDSAYKGRIDESEFLDTDFILDIIEAKKKAQSAIAAAWKAIRQALKLINRKNA